MKTSARLPVLFRAAPWLLLLLALPARAAGTISISIDGIDEPLRRNVLLYLSIAQQKSDPDLSPGRVQALHARAPDEIRTALQPFGYYRPRIDARLEPEEYGWSARYRIDPGPRLTITTLDLRITGEGAGDPEFVRLRAALPLKRGAPLNHAQYDNARSALQDLALERGYFDAQMQQHELRIDLESYTSTITLHFDTGARYRFGPVSFGPVEGLRPDLLPRYVPFKPGDPFVNSKLLELQRALSDTDYFQQVEVRPRRDEAQGLNVPIDVRLTRRKPNKYSLGLGYGTDTGIRGSAQWERPLVNEDGHRVSTGVEASQIKFSLLARYLIPVGDPRTDKIAITAGWIDDHPETSSSQKATAGVSLIRQRGRWQDTWSLNYLNENFRTGTDSGHSTMFVPGTSWLLTRTDNPVYTHRGYRLQLDLRGTAQALASDVSFLQTRIAGKYIYPVGTENRLIARTDLGATSVAQFENLPVTFRFYTGGDQSVRGYEYNTIGTKDALGNVIGGRYLAVGSLEYEQHLYGRWSAAVFYDVGNAFSSSSEPFQEGAGAGLRWRSPIGLVRVDLASALSLPDHPWRVHIVIGPDL